MKNVELKRCLSLAEAMYEVVGVDKVDINVCFINRDRVTVCVDCNGAEIEISIRPKGADNEQRAD